MPTFKFQSPEGKTYEIEGPEGATEEQAFEQLQRSLGTQRREPSSRPVQFARGAARGLAGFASTLGDIVPDPTSYFMPQRGREALERGREDIRQFATAPSEGGWETAGRIAGGVAPLAVQPEFIPARLAAYAPRLAGLARAATTGAVAGGMQPTEEGTLAAHARGAALGAATAGALRGFGYAAPSAAWLGQMAARHGTTSGLIGALHAAGLPWMHGLWLWFALHNNPLSKLAGQAVGGGIRGVGAAARVTPSAAVGAAVGQAAGRQGNGQIQAPTGGVPAREPGPVQDQRSPIESDFEALGPARGPSQRSGNNDTATDQRFDRGG